MQPAGLLSIPSPKAAQPTPQASRHTPADDGRETDPTPPTTGKKAKTKKTKPPSAAIPPAPAPSPSPAPAPTPAPGPKSKLSALLQGDFAADSHILLSGPSHRISGALDAADALVELLSADPTAASVDLVLSTTLRALKAVQAVFSRMVARYGSTTGTSGTCSDDGLAAGKTWDPALTLDILVGFVQTLVCAVVPALLARYAAAKKETNSRRFGLKRAGAACATARATLTSIDDILGGVYELLLVPAVRAFVLLSEGHLVACFSGTSTPRGKKRLDDAPPAVPDLRPDVFTLLEGLLAILDDVLPHIAPPSPSARSPGRTPAAAPAPIPGSDQVKTMLALECIRELERLYHPHTESPSQDASDSPAQAYSRPAHTPASLAASSSGTHAARPGTAPATLPFLERAHPRAARDLGETASGPAQHGGPVRDSPRAGAASASGGKAQRGRRARQVDAGVDARIAKLATKDAVWWLCAVLDRLLPCLPPPSAGLGRETTAGDDHTAYSGPVPAYNGPTGTAAVGADIAHEAVYAALADLLRRTRARASPRAPSSRPPPPPASPSSSPRGLSPRASNHAESSPPAPGEAMDDVGPGPSIGAGGGKSKRGLEKASTPSRGECPRTEDRRAGWAGAGDVGMGEVERGMLLAVLERAWLGV
ncbi:uncharacterized protein TRAVEDRAFT_68788 [Trametes versicolor FP-101664 SS1]|uniref:uncharacterized protein n=1 Tax=Trametes versicolor (strain FP-101664) TaxID=717944 RepID=UPI0004622842|nr:uncharacterized protein TRAVEDRAFT_68788 [Trametes versicolor FP-101664 SS1]EIW65262.1 hypothetical protein TRAVEDRAFT_68788 [Trametes versicolor FP-101664 SS1]